MKQSKKPLPFAKAPKSQPISYEVIDWTEYLRIPQGNVDWKALASIFTVLFKHRVPQELRLITNNHSKSYHRA